VQIGYKKWFFKGLAALLPTLVTLVILVYLVAFINDNFGKYIGQGLAKGAGWAWADFLAPTPEQVDAYLLKTRGITPKTTDPETYRKLVAQARPEIQKHNIDELGRSWVMVLLGFIIALIIVTILGLFLASFIGRQFWGSVEQTFTRIPVVRQIYPYVKQVTDYIFGQKKFTFSQVVAIPYPRKGLWQIGFITGPAIDAFQAADPDGREYVTVFVPTSPTPFTGYVVIALKEEVLNLPITIDQAVRFLVSGGVISPDHFLPPGTEHDKLESSKTDV